MSDETAKSMQTVGQTAMIQHDYGDDAGAGYEGQTAADQSVPYTVLLQSGSPEVKKELVEGAKAGFWYCHANEQLYTRDRGFLFCPAFTQHKFGLWVPRDSGGGFKGNLDPDDPQVLRAAKRAEEERRLDPKIPYGKLKTDDGQLTISECFYVYGVICDEESAEPVCPTVIGFKSTMIQPYRKWNTRMNGLRARTPSGSQKPPLFAHLVRITSFEDNNTKGDFYVPMIKPADPRGMLQSLLSPVDPRFQAARDLSQIIKSGQRQADFAQSGGDDAGGSSVRGDDIM